MSAKEERKKRDVPAPLQKLLAVDKVVTKKFCLYMEKILPYTQYRKHYKFLEYSCHTLPWLFSTIAALWLLWNEDLFQTQVNLLFGIFIARVFVCSGKYLLQRSRPKYENTACSSENFSFPSASSSIATFVACFFCYLNPLYQPLRWFLAFWVMIVSISRVLIRKNYILDVLGGIAMGYMAAWTLYKVWLDDGISHFIWTLLAKKTDCP